MGCGTIGGDLGSIQYLWRKFRGMGGLLRLHRCDHRRDYCRNAHDDHDAGHVVGKHLQRHLRRPHPGFDGTVGMFDGHAADRQLDLCLSVLARDRGRPHSPIHCRQSLVAAMRGHRLWDNN